METKTSVAETRFRVAGEPDLISIVRLLAEDQLGATRELSIDPLPQEYIDAFAAIDTDPNNELVVAVLDATIVGVLQLTYNTESDAHGKLARDDRRGASLFVPSFRWDWH